MQNSACLQALSQFTGKARVSLEVSPMFESAQLDRKISREEFAEREPGLRERLLDAQARLQTANFSVVVVVAVSEPPDPVPRSQPVGTDRRTSRLSPAIVVQTVRVPEVAIVRKVKRITAMRSCGERSRGETSSRIIARRSQCSTAKIEDGRSPATGLSGRSRCAAAGLVVSGQALQWEEKVER